jgi:cell division protein FtsI/penicillin-binding protein 2
MSRTGKKLYSINPAVICMAGLFGFAGLSQIKLQGFEAEKTTELANKVNKYFVEKKDRAKRGSIYCRDLTPLAVEADSYILTINFAKIPRLPGFGIALSEATGIPVIEFSDREKGTRSWPMELSADQMKMVAGVKKEWAADGVSIESARKRSYPLGQFTSPFVGFQRVQAGEEKKLVRIGLEASLNEVLQGVDGRQRGLQDNNGDFLPLRSYEPDVIRKDGSKVVTTIDANIQTAAALAIRKAVISNKADDGAAIVANPKTGEVYAMATWPASDPNDGAQSKYDGKNPVYKEVLEPGSTFKILTLAKAYSEGLVREGMYWNCNGTLKLNSVSAVHCDRSHAFHGDVDAVGAIAKSCNVTSAQWALKIGNKNFLDYLGDLGLREKTKLELSGEVNNLISPDPGAPKLQLATWGFGQSMSVTPISLTRAFCSIANGGFRIPLRLVRSIDGVEQKPKSESKRILSQDACDYTLHCMQAVMEKGTGRSMQMAGYDLGGKTGTAQKLGKNVKGGYVSNFIGVVPAKDPQAVVLIMVNNPKGGKFYGADVAGPVFTDVAHSVIKNLKIQPTRLMSQTSSMAPQN